MIYTKDNFAIYISFEDEDWKSGFAKRSIEKIKSISVSEREYDKSTKYWRIIKTPQNIIRKLNMLR